MILTLKKACLASVFQSGGSGDPEINADTDYQSQPDEIGSHLIAVVESLAAVFWTHWSHSSVSCETGVPELNRIQNTFWGNMNKSVTDSTLTIKDTKAKTMHLWNPCNCLVCMHVTTRSLAMHLCIFCLWSVSLSTMIPNQEVLLLLPGDTWLDCVRGSTNFNLVKDIWLRGSENEYANREN